MCNNCQCSCSSCDCEETLYFEDLDGYADECHGFQDVSSEITPEEWEIIKKYHALVDRFSNGNDIEELVVVLDRAGNEHVLLHEGAIG